MTQNKYITLLENFKPVQLNYNSRVLVVDGLNNFIRTFSTNPSANDDGEHIGGLTGFLLSVGYAIKQIQPTRVIIVFDGKGGSQRRREIFPDYKANRTPGTPIKRSFTLSTDEDPRQSMSRQLVRLVEYLDVLPVTTLSIDHIEADDTIAYLTNLISAEEGHTYIMSTDRDFLQLIDHNVIVWSPTKKKMYFKQDILDEYNISATNFLLYRMLTGDKSDNIPGISGIGIKTLLKKVPHLKEDLEIDLNSLYEHCIKNAGDKVLDKIIQHKSLLDTNHKLMQLKDVNISGNAKSKILNMFEYRPNIFNKNAFFNLLIKDKSINFIKNVDGWSNDVFGKLSMYLRN